MKTCPHLTDAIEQIDKELGRGYAKEHPELVGQYLVAHAIREIDETLSTSAQAFLQLADKCVSVSGLLKSLFPR